MILTPSVRAGSQVQFPPSEKRKIIPLNQPRSSEPCLQEPALQEPRETCWEETGMWGAGDLGLDPPSCCLNQGCSPSHSRPQCSTIEWGGLILSPVPDYQDSRDQPAVTDRILVVPSSARHEPSAEWGGTEHPACPVCFSQSENGSTTYFPPFPHTFLALCLIPFVSTSRSNVCPATSSS